MKKGARPAYFCLKKNLNASSLCFLHIKKRSVLCSVPSNIRTGPTDAKGGLSLSDESFPNEGARGAFAKPSRSLQEGSAKPSRSVSSRRLRGASKAQPRTLRGGLRTLRGGCTYRRLHEDALEGSRGLLEGSVNELRVPTRSWL